MTDNPGNPVQPPGNPTVPGVPQAPADDLARVNADLAASIKAQTELTGQVTTTTARIAALEAEARKAQETATAAIAEVMAKADKATATHAAILGKYTALVAAANPAIPAELLTGSTVEDVEAALTRGKALVEKVKAAIEAEAKAKDNGQRIPPGAPGRTGPDLEGLSAREKIQAGLTKKA